VLSSPSDGRGRYSVPFFYNPDYDTVVEPLDCSLSLPLPLSSSSSSVNHNDSSKSRSSEVEVAVEGTTQLSSIQTITSSSSSSSSSNSSSGSSILRDKKYAAIRWGDYRTKRYLGDYHDEGDEIQIEHFQKT